MTGPTAPPVPLQISTVMEHVPCNACGADDAQVLYPMLDQRRVEAIPLDERFAASSDIQGGEQIVRCRRCGLAYMDPRVIPSSIMAGYTEADNSTYVSQSSGRMSTFRRCVKLLEPYAGTHRRAIDIGCAGGFFVKAADEAGWEVHGVEPSRYLVDYARRELGLSRVEQGTLGDRRYPDGFFDAVTYWDVLEHLHDPMQELREVSRVVRPGCVVLINYPNFASVWSRLLGRKWWFVLSVHLYYFTPDTMRKMLDQVGYDVIESRMHFQELSLGYLFMRLESYAPAVGRLGGRVAKVLRIAEWPVRYYASQVNVIAKRKGSLRVQTASR